MTVPFFILFHCLKFLYKVLENVCVLAIRALLSPAWLISTTMESELPKVPRRAAGNWTSVTRQMCLLSETPSAPSCLSIHIYPASLGSRTEQDRVKKGYQWDSRGDWLEISFYNILSIYIFIFMLFRSCVKYKPAYWLVVLQKNSLWYSCIPFISTAQQRIILNKTKINTQTLAPIKSISLSKYSFGKNMGLSWGCCLDP